MIKYVLLALFIILLLCIPIYAFVQLPDEQKIRGCRMPFIMALFIKIFHPDNIIFVSYDTFQHFWTKAEEINKNNIDNSDEM